MTIGIRQMTPDDWPATDATGIWTVQSAVFPENESSLALQTDARVWARSGQERMGARTLVPNRHIRAAI
jgi:hypothetical protein